MVLLDEILYDENQFYSMLSDGYVSRRFHPEFPELAILNYTEKAAFERKWNLTTRTCRGLIYNTDTHEVLARPFAKFHNWNEAEAPAIGWDTPLYHWSNKEDGSLGIIFINPEDDLEVATRGSFESDQAKHATQWLERSWIDEDSPKFEVYQWAWDLIEWGYTPLVEIVYPENRIVLDYGGRDELIPLGGVHKESGYFVPYTPAEPRTFRSLVADTSRQNAEGWVAWINPLTAVKIKQDDYVELHRIVTGLNRKSVWRALKDGEPTFKALQEQLPDELYAWSTDVAKELREQYASIIRTTDNRYVDILHADVWEYGNAYDPEAKLDRKKFALAVQKEALPHERGFMFALLDGKDISDKVWSMVEPVGGDR